MIESIDKVCKQQKLTPDTTISQLIHSTDSYSFGTVGVLVTAHKQEPTEFQVQVKDGELPSDTATLTVPKIHTNSYATLEKLLTPTKSKFLLLKNVIRNGTRGASNIKSSLSTFIGELNDECTKSSLQTLGSSNTQVAGISRTKNVYLPPFQPLCNICHHIVSTAHISTNNISHCTTCASTTTFSYQHFCNAQLRQKMQILTATYTTNFCNITFLNLQRYHLNIMRKALLD